MYKPSTGRMHQTSWFHFPCTQHMPIQATTDQTPVDNRTTPDSQPAGQKQHKSTLRTSQPRGPGAKAGLRELGLGAEEGGWPARKDPPPNVGMVLVLRVPMGPKAGALGSRRALASYLQRSSGGDNPILREDN